MGARVLQISNKIYVEINIVSSQLAFFFHSFNGIILLTFFLNSLASCGLLVKYFKTKFLQTQYLYLQ
jgi:succinate dehydrogenase/fumarate reductase cytochrome b subunit